MRILQIGATFVGAQQQIEYGIHRFLKKRGEESYILYTIGTSDDPDIIKCETRIENFLRRGMQKLLGKDPRFAAPCTRRMVRLIRKIKPDVIHLHILHHGYLDYPMLLREIVRLKIPVVYTQHDLWAATGGCYYYSELGCPQAQTGCRECTAPYRLLDCKPKQTQRYFQEKQSLFCALSSIVFVSVSPWVQEELLHTQLSAYRQTVIWNAVDLPDVLSRAPLLPPTKKFRIIGVAANWDARKGIRSFIRLASLLGSEFEVVLVGHIAPSDAQLLPENVLAVGSVFDKGKLLQLYSECDLHVSLSTEETFGLTLIEAAWVGRRSMGFDATAIPGVLNKINGFVVEKGNVDAVAEQIRDIAQKREKLQLSEEEIHTIKSFFSAKRMADEYYGLYVEIAKGM